MRVNLLKLYANNKKKLYIISVRDFLQIKICSVLKNELKYCHLITPLIYPESYYESSTLSFNKGHI